MSGLAHLHTLALGNRPENDGLLGNARCAWGGIEHLSQEAIMAAFAAQRVEFGEGALRIETRQGAAILDEGAALIADLYDGRIGRMWRVGAGMEHPSGPSVDVAFDPDMRQERGDLSFRAEDHPELDGQVAERLLDVTRDLLEEQRKAGKLRVRAFVIRAFGGPEGAAALIALFTLGNEERRSASFSYAVVGIDRDGVVSSVRDDVPARDWTPRL